jgi:hypothetical protein
MRPFRDLLEKRAAIYLFTAITVILFSIDLATPAGIDDGVGYPFAMVFCVWMRTPRLTRLCAIMTTMLVVSGYFFTIATGLGPLSIINRVLAILGIWAISYTISEQDSKQQKRRV